MTIQVIKKDGSLQPFDHLKIRKVVIAAGLTSEEGDLLAKKMKSWVKKLKKEKVSTKEIRNEVVSELKKVNPYAAQLFVWYEKTKKNFLKKKQ